MRLDTPQFHRWLAAERQLKEAERQLWHAILGREGEQPPPAPPAALTAEVAAMRTQVHALFHEAMQEMRQVSGSLRYRGAPEASAGETFPKRGAPGPRGNAG